MCACTPGSLKLGDEPETGTGPETEGMSEGASEPTTAGDETGAIEEPVPEGVLEWEQMLEDFAGAAVAVGPDGTIVVLGQQGYTKQGDGGTYESWWLGKFAADGEVVWSHATMNTGETTPIPLYLSVGGEGEIFVGVVGFGGGGDAVQMFAPDGELVWSTSVTAQIQTVQATPEGGVIAGGVESLDGSSGVAWMISLDGAGDVRWKQTIDALPMAYNQVRSIAIAGDDIVLAGSVGLGPSGLTEAWLRRSVRATGEELWDRTVAAEATDWAENVGVTADGTILVVYVVGGIRTVRAYTPAGEEQWSFVPGLATGIEDMAVTADGSFTLVDGLYLPPDDPDACHGDFSPCPVRMQVERRWFDRTARWEVVNEECSSAHKVAMAPDDGVVVLAGCTPEFASKPVMGLLRYAP